MLLLSSNEYELRIKFEKITLGKDVSLNVKKIKKKRFDSSLHFHPEIEITLILKSNGTRFVGDNISSFGRDDLVMIGTNLPHYWSNDNITDDSDGGSEAIVVQFEAGCMGKDFFEGPEMIHIKKLLNRSSKGLAIHGKTQSTISKQMRKILKSYPFKRVMVLLSILDILANSNEIEVLSSEGFPQNYHHSDSIRINEVYNYISAHLTDGVDVSQAAKNLSMSVSAFCHYFKKKTNKTFSRAVNEMRIGHANRLLLETDLKILEICYQSGFNNLSNFNKQFKSINGVTPRGFRTRYDAVY